MELAASIKNLGVILDADLSMRSHVANICHACFCHLKELCRVRWYFTTETAVSLTTAIPYFTMQISQTSIDCNEYKISYAVWCANSANLL